MARAVRGQPEPVPVSAAPVQGPSPSPPVEEHHVIGVDVQMFSSLPPMASGADVYMRQFYRGTKLPLRRYLPLRGL